MYERQERCIQGFCGEDLKDRGHLEDEGVDRRTILKWIFKRWNVGIDLVDLVQDRDRWQALVNAVTNLRVPENAGKFLTI
jgi:hypothetical protein